jgi:divalent metal cation (Fe/Co/Zn/Cd) transporter
VTVVGHRDLPREQVDARRKAIRWEWITIGYTAMTITLVALVMGNSQSMRTAWIEDMLSLIPQVSFLLALLFIRKPSTKTFPFGRHRAMSVGHLVAGVALLAVGANLAIEAAVGLLRGERASIGTVQLFGHTIWLGWLMVAVMVVIVIGPFIYGPAKLKLAPVLHNKLLYADAAMAKADWHTNAASIVGVLGIGVGLWWLDGAAALFISVGIVHDGIRSTRHAVRDIMDERARTFDDEHTHPLIDEVLAAIRRQPWVKEAGVRMRDQGQVFHVEVFFVPWRRRPPTTDTLEDATRQLAELDWKLQDVVLIPVSTLPEEAMT